MSAKKNLIGKIFSNWEVIYETNKRKHGFVVWVVKCLKCNNIYEVTTGTLKVSN